MIRPMCLALLAGFLWTAAAHADEELPFLPAEKLAAPATLFSPGKDLPPQVEINGPAPAPVTVLVAMDPKVPSHRYMLRGKVMFKDVDQVAFVEMWSHFGDQGQFFSRTLAPSGPMGHLHGASDGWRELLLPFQSEPGKTPTKLVVNVVIPGKGTVKLAPFTLTTAPAELWAEAPAAVAGEWWSERQSGWLGAIGGSVIGMIGGIIGTLAGLGAARQLAVGLCVAVVACGGLCLVAGLVALSLGQPWHVFFPFLLIGGIGAIVCGAKLRTVRKRYDDLELRRMSALDA
jgi:hypothetical protein